MIGASARIQPGAEIHPTARIGEFVVVEAGAVLAAETIIGDHSIIRRDARIGSRTELGAYNIVGPGAILGMDGRSSAYCEIRSGCRIGDRFRMGSRGTLSAGTVVGDDVIMRYGFVATDTPELADEGFRAFCTIEDRAMFGANVVLMPGIRVGAAAVIGACSQVRCDIPPGTTWFGSPARLHRRG